MPLLVRWPGVTPPGSLCTTPVITPDFYPTLLEMAGLKPARHQVIDGRSLVPLLRQRGAFRRNALYWHYPHYHPGGATPYSAVRAGDWKLIEFFEDQHVELYHLRDDLGEANDLAATHPAKARALRRQLHSCANQRAPNFPRRIPTSTRRILTASNRSPHDKQRTPLPGLFAETAAWFGSQISLEKSSAR